jgi:hypothetical protein
MAAAITGGVVAAALRNKKDKKNEEEKNDPTKYAAAQLEEKVEDKREKPKLKVKRDGEEGFLEAEDDDLDILTDSVHAALVSYYKRKHGYTQCCKYLFFWCFLPL